MGNSALDHATASLRELIVRGRYRPGDRLPAEREMAEGLGLSRPTMREAMRRLIEVGLLEPRRGSGTYIADVDLDAVFEVRMQLEPYAAGLAARRRSAEQARRLMRAVTVMEELIEDSEAFTIADLEVHAIVAEAAGNAVLADMLGRLTELAKLSRALTSPAVDLRLIAIGHLHGVAAAIEVRDPERAAEKMTTHLGTVRTVVDRALEQQRRRSRRLNPMVLSTQPDL